MSQAKHHVVSENDVEIGQLNTVDSVSLSNHEVTKPLYKPNGYEPYIVPNSAGPIISWSNVSVSTLSISSNFYDRLKESTGLFQPYTQSVGKVILNNVSGQIFNGLHGVMGSSGSGKTTLLNALSHRLDPFRMEVSGLYYLNGREYNVNDVKNVGAYVMQDDVLHSEFTVYETLWYHSHSRLGGEYNYSERIRRLGEVLQLMGLYHRRNVVVGDSRNKGISGGERKRLCIAIELLTQPRLLFLDEPTSGLDSDTAYDLIKTLRDLSENDNTTIICTIHQPQRKVFELFHNLTLMRDGEVAYQGNTLAAANYFNSIGFPAPPNTNPADHILDILALNAHAKSDSTKKNHIAYLQPVDIDFTAGKERRVFAKRATTSWPVQFFFLFIRALHQHVRNYHIHLFNIVASIIVAIFVIRGPWENLGLSTANLGKRPAVLFFCAIHEGLIFSYQTINAFPRERAIMLRERQNGTYRVSAYFLGKSLADMIVQIPEPVIFASIVYFPVGLQDTAHKFRNFVWLLILGCQAATAMTTMIACIFLSVEVTVVVLAVSFEITRLFGGWFVSPILLKNLTQWKFQDALSYLKYTFIGISLNEYQGLVLNCTPAQITAKSICTGDRYLRTFGLEQYTVAQCGGYLIVLIAGFRFASYIALRFVKL
eukprot:gene12159-16282_t